MCGRYNITDMPGLQGLLDYLGIDVKLPEPRYNIAPTEDVLLLHDGKGENARWWLVPSWAKEVNTKYSMFNARSDKLTKSPAFRRPFKNQRGIVPMSSFLEWRTEAGVKIPWLITNEPHTMAVAALWDLWEGEETPLLSCTIITTDTAPEFEPWHNRMPVMLAADELSRWMDNSHQIPGDDPVFRPELKFPLYLSPLDRAASNARNKEAEVMEPVGDAVTIPE